MLGYSGSIKRKRSTGDHPHPLRSFIGNFAVFRISFFQQCFASICKKMLYFMPTWTEKRIIVRLSNFFWTHSVVFSGKIDFPPHFPPSENTLFLFFLAPKNSSSPSGFLGASCAHVTLPKLIEQLAAAYKELLHQNN